MTTNDLEKRRLRGRQDQIVREFAGLQNWDEKYGKIIDEGKALTPLPSEFRTDEYRVKGCQSQVWLHAQLNANGEVVLTADSDALIVRGLVALLLRVYSEATPGEILQSPPEFIAALGLSSHLSPSRANGLQALVRQIQYYALAFSAAPSSSERGKLK